jgi:hypothetical protein
MARVHRKRHVKLAAFGCVKCGRFLFAPNSYQLDRDVGVCACDAARYKTTNVRAPEHVQAYWDAQCSTAYSSYRRRLKHYALPSVHVERLASNALSWSVINVDIESEREVRPDVGTNTPPQNMSSIDNTAKSINVKRQTISIWDACRSALVSRLSRVADVRRESKGKAS